MSTTTDIAWPPDTSSVTEWELTERTRRTGMPDPIRYFVGTTRTVGEDIEVQIEGVQHSDGRVERSIGIPGYGEGCRVNSADARGLARALIAAADEIDQLADTR
jgi:hypothetical protein